MVRMMGMVSTGVVVRVRETGAEYGMHAPCADVLMDSLVEATGISPLAGDFPAVVIGPLFAETGEWTCARNGCPEEGGGE